MAEVRSVVMSAVNFVSNLSFWRSEWTQQPGLPKQVWQPDWHRLHFVLLLDRKCIFNSKLLLSG